MNISDDVIKTATLISSSNISDDIYKKLVENAFSVLLGKPEIYNLSNLYNSKPDVIKSIYGAVLTLAAEFGRHNLDKDSVSTFLASRCSLSSKRADLFSELYRKNKQDLQVALGNIGSHTVPHITDIKWKIDYIVKSSVADEVQGPLFRISLVTEKYDEVAGSRGNEEVKFNCNSAELQDLVYKLKEATKHCHKLATDR